MIAAFTIWGDRIAPVFDVARLIHLVEAESGLIIGESQEPLPDDLTPHKAIRLAELGAGMLVCGAISRPAYTQVAAYGIRIFPFVAGNLQDVIQAWLNDSLENDNFAMPGCYSQRHRRGFQGLRGSLAVVPDGVCLCPNCGHREPHERGVPCVQKQCPECGTFMLRGH